MTSQLASETGRTVDVHYLSMSARYADHVVGLALQSADAELKAMGAILRHDFFGPGGLFPGGKMTWCAPATSEPREALPAWRQSIDSAAELLAPARNRLTEVLRKYGMDARPMDKLAL